MSRTSAKSPAAPRPKRSSEASVPAKKPRATRDAEATRQAILEAAIVEFASGGLAGARVDKITERAGCNLRMMYYYFGSKEDLYIAALEKVYADFVAAERMLDFESLDPVDGIRAVIGFTWEYMRDHPEFIGLLTTENMNGGRFARRSTVINNGAGPQLLLLEKLLKRGIADGVFRPETSVVETHLTIVSLCYFYLSNRATISNYLGYDMTSDAARTSWLKHASRVVIDSLVNNALP